MYYGIIDYLYDTASNEQAKLYSDIFDLLDAIPYTDYEDSVSDILMTVDIYPTSNTMGVLEAMSDEALRAVLSRYGVFLENHMDIALKDLYLICSGVYSIYNTVDSEIISILTDEETSGYNSFIEALAVLTGLDECSLSSAISEILPMATSYAAQLVDVSESEEGTVSVKAYQLERLANYAYFMRVEVAKEYFKSINSMGYSYVVALNALSEDLTALDDITLAIELVALYYGSNGAGDAYSAIAESIDIVCHDAARQASILNFVNKAISGTLEEAKHG